MQPKLQWLQKPSQLKRNIHKIVRRETSRTFRNKERNIWKIKLVTLKQTVKSGL
jgi:hypothetical protein